MSLRLFAIRKESEEQPIADLHFSNMLYARRIRDDLTRKTGEAHVVCHGPDHKKYKKAHAK